LPTSIREAQSIVSFRHHLKTYYFQSAFSTPYRPARQDAMDRGRWKKLIKIG